MKRKTYLISAALVLCLCISFGIAFYHNAKKNITIGVFVGSNWNVPTANSYAIVEDVIARYESINPNIKVNFMSGIRKEDYSEWIAQASLEGNAPDIFFVLSDDFATFHQVGLLENLDSYIQRDSRFDANAYYPSSYKAGMNDGHMFALPYESVPNLVFVNKTLLENEGIELPSNDWTWDDFYNICQQVSRDTDGDGKIDQFGVYGYDWEDALFANNVALFEQDQIEASFNSQNSIEAIEFLRKLNTLNENAYITSQLFDEGKVAFCIMPFSEYRTYMPYPWRVKKYATFEWDCIMLPAGYHGENVSKIDTLLIGMNAKSKHKSDAWELLKMLSYDTETQLQIFSSSQGVSVLKDVTKSEEAMNILFHDTPGNSLLQMSLLSKVMEYGKSQYRFKNYESLKSLIDNEVYRIINSESDIPTEMVSLQHKIEALLKQ